MPRIARFVLPGHAHHVLQRGNNDQPVFVTDDDRIAYLDLLREESERHGFDVIGYCLMPNHLHIIGITGGPDSLARAVGRAHFRYAQQFNRVHKRGGHFWHNRFHSCLLEGAPVLSALRHIERNPVRAGLARQAWQWPWSSASAHLGEIDFSNIINAGRWLDLSRGQDWRAELKRHDDKVELERLRLATSTGRPWTSEAFLHQLEAELGRRLHALAPGRPKRMTDTE
ncbi:transposase [bacterium]|nr:transposase [bacterium]